MDHADVARGLTRQLRELLIEHVNGGTYVEAPFDAQNKYRRRSMAVLMERQLIRFTGYKRHNTTRITEDGRQVLAFILAEYAEALIRAGRIPPSAVSEGLEICVSAPTREIHAPSQPERKAPSPSDSGLEVEAI